MQEPIEHDNIDRDIIIINKDSLLLRILHCKEYYTSQIAAPTFFGISISLLIPGFLSESFRSMGPIPGETIRSSLLVLGIIAFVLSGYFFWKWYRSRETHEPQTIVNSLLRATLKETKLKAENLKPTKTTKSNL